MLEHSEQRYKSTTKKLRQVSTTNYKIKEPHSTATKYLQNCKKYRQDLLQKGILKETSMFELP